MDEIWATIEDFPNYSVSSFGNVVNKSTDRLIKISRTSQGALKVGLVKGRKQYTRSVKVLVATYFVDGHSDIFDTPIHLDTDQENVRADNLVWRPRWFAFKYSRQFFDFATEDVVGKLRDRDTGKVYDNVLEVVMQNGLLIQDVRASIYRSIRTFPTKQLFELV